MLFLFSCHLQSISPSGLSFQQILFSHQSQKCYYIMQANHIAYRIFITIDVIKTPSCNCTKKASVQVKMIPLILHRILMGGYREKSMFELKIDNSDKEILVSPQLLCKFG